MHALASYLIAALLAWCPVARQSRMETADEAKVRYAAIAQDISAVVFDEAEPPLYTGDRARERTGLILAALAVQESALRRDVDLGVCRQGDARGDSDSCHAFTLWQIHANDNGGIVTDGTGLRFIGTMSPEWQQAHWFDVLRGVDLVRDRKLAARVALHMARVSVQNWTTAKNASAMAQKYWYSHPFSG
jgi:hypothetical protein